MDDSKTKALNFSASYWLRFSLFNLFLVAFLGSLMRYKIGFEFPHFNQKYIQHAHSHFAFAGWITQSLYVLLVNHLSTNRSDFYYPPFRRVLLANLLCAYGMLISFFLQGYSFLSITFSTLSIVLACVFAFLFFRELKRQGIHNSYSHWFKSALWFNIISSIGTFYLAYIMISRNFNENWYLAAVYFYLHFQYNGFFLFSCMGLAVNGLNKHYPHYTIKPILYKLFLWTAIPAYFLSVLWAKLPSWLYVIVVVAAIVQLIPWFILLKELKQLKLFKNLKDKLVYSIFLFVILAYTTKLFLQLGSTVPIISKLAFGFRPVVIAYLHLVLLAVISVFLLGYAYSMGLFLRNKRLVSGIIIFLSGVLLNELLLGLQGIASFSYVVIPNIQFYLFLVSLLLLSGALMMLLSQLRSSSQLQDLREIRK